MPRLKIKYIKIHRATGVSPWVSTKMKSLYFKIPAIIILLSGVFGLSLYGYYYPPVKEILLPDLVENTVVHFQYFPLEVSAILNDKVELQDRAGNRAVCVPLNGMKAHPSLRKGKRIDATITMHNGECILLESVDGSGYRLYKIMISIITMFLVTAYFLSHYSYHPGQIAFDKRKKHA